MVLQPSVDWMMMEGGDDCVCCFVCYLVAKFFLIKFICVLLPKLKIHILIILVYKGQSEYDDSLQYQVPGTGQTFPLPLTVVLQQYPGSATWCLAYRYSFDKKICEILL